MGETRVSIAVGGNDSAGVAESAAASAAAAAVFSAESVPTGFERRDLLCVALSVCCGREAV